MTDEVLHRSCVGSEIELDRGAQGRNGEKGVEKGNTVEG